VHLKQLLSSGQVEAEAVAWLARVVLKLAKKVVEVQ
jgi:1,6-anhydro-N-acetylmuramate kinase